jgi:hypothetical protein
MSLAGRVARAIAVTAERAIGIDALADRIGVSLVRDVLIRHRPLRVGGFVALVR